VRTLKKKIRISSQPLSNRLLILKLPVMGDLVQTASGMKMAGMNYVRLEMKGVYQSHH
jgi:hypothetical protein